MHASPILSNRSIEPLAFTISEACRVSGLGKTSIYRLVNEGKLELRKVGNRSLITARSLRHLIEGEAA